MVLYAIFVNVRFSLAKIFLPCSESIDRDVIDTAKIDALLKLSESTMYQYNFACICFGCTVAFSHCHGALKNMLRA